MLLENRTEPQHLECHWNWQGALVLALSTVNSIASAATCDAAAQAAVAAGSTCSSCTMHSASDPCNIKLTFMQKAYVQCSAAASHQR
jgi:hypothetical protein